MMRSAIRQQSEVMPEQIYPNIPYLRTSKALRILYHKMLNYEVGCQVAGTRRQYLTMISILLSLKN